MKKMRILSMILAVIFTIALIPAISPVSVLAAAYEGYDRVTFVKEDFNSYNEGSIDGQGNWTITVQGDTSYANIVSNDGDNALSFSRTSKDSTQRITLVPTVNENLYFNEGDKLSISVDFMTAGRGDSDRLYCIDFGNGKDLTFDIDKGRIGPWASGFLYLDGSSASSPSKFTYNKPYRLELVFNYATNKIEAYLDGEFETEVDISASADAYLSSIPQIQIWSYSTSHHNSPQYIDNIKIEKIVAPAPDRVVYISEDFEDLKEGEINGQSAWTATDDSKLISDVVTVNGSKMLQFSKTGANGQRISFAPQIDKPLYFAEGDKLSLSFDFMGSERDANSWYYIYLGNAAEKDDTSITIDMQKGSIDAYATGTFSPNGGSSFVRNQFYHIEIVFDYTAGKVAVYLNGKLDEEKDMKSPTSLNPDKIEHIQFYTYSSQCIGTPQHIDNIKVEKIVAPVTSKVAYISEDFEDLKEGEISGQSAWTATDDACLVSDVVTVDGNKMLKFYKTSSASGQRISFAPQIDKALYFDEGDKLSLSFDFMGSERDSTSIYYVYLGNAAEKDDTSITIDMQKGSIDAHATDTFSPNGGSSFVRNQFYHIEIVFDYTAGKVAVYLNGKLDEEKDMKSPTSLTPDKIEHIQFYTYSSQCINTPQYIDNIRVDKIPASDYFITSVTGNENVEVTAKAAGTAINAKIVVASYDADGKLIMADLRNIEKMLISEVPVAGADKVKVFMLASNLEPLCVNYEGNVVSGRIVEVLK